MNKFIFICFMQFFFIGCTTTSPDVLEMRRIRSNYVKKQELKHDLIVSGLGVAMFDKIREIKIYFISDQQLELEDARKLIVGCFEDLINDVNNDEKIRPFLFNYPFNYENADIYISFRNPHYVEPPFIAFIFRAKNKICYCQNDPVTDTFIDFHEESYDEALRIVKEQECL